MAKLKPLSDTQRVVEWEELPPSVRDVPDNFDPLADGVLMKHQRQWVALKASLKACPKGRRTGITFAEALDDTITAASRKSAGGDNVYYIGDTKEKGLEFVGYCAKFARVIAQAQGDGVSDIEEFLFSDQDADGNTKFITAYRIRFASGFQVAALSSRPANIRGLQGKVVIDEAAFHGDVQGVLDAATALLIWGGQIAVISSHNGKANAFNKLVQDIDSGRYGPDAKTMTVTFDEAVANGLFERVCLMKGWQPTAKAKAEWYAKIRNAYGPRKSAMREELDAIPRDGNSLCLPGIWIENAMREERPVLRIALDDDFVRLSEAERESWCQDWIARYLDPELTTLSKTNRHDISQDFARHRDFSVITPYETADNLNRRVPFLLEMHKVPTRLQEMILWHIIDHLPNFHAAAMDATGNGETLAEYTADRYGHERVFQIKLNRTWYGQNMPKMIRLFEDGSIDLPIDANIESDLHSIVEVDGIPMVPDIRIKDLKDPDLMRHGDAAISLCLAEFAARQNTQSLVTSGYHGISRGMHAASSRFGRGTW
ncbi:hypothetical protein [Chromobacterium haemolyticum]|uniref:hypothetical protein n=1 Tax=Chromobacterium haemolyticum TaxID=394935 RepID=UPI0015E7523C|nr:hypothetical protein [Chromobacterium haemolyticum]